MKRPSRQLPLRLETPAAPTPWCDGGRIRHLDADLILRLATGREAVLRDGGDLRITLPPQATPRQIRDCVEAWLRDEARRLIEAAVCRHAARLGRPPPPWRLSFAARGGWAQVDRGGRLCFHWRLIEQPPAIVDQVVGLALATQAPVAAGNDLFAAFAV
jgi:predicted metal-dependent hydrolase